MTKDEVEARILSGEPFTYGALCDWRLGTGDQGENRDRLIDRSIQRLRRKGLIAFKREGGKVVWRTVA
jgi:hypothetical protein